jgi:hypothetical protein
MECDVLVAGGGSAGLAAAVAAARLGARTLLVERHGALGGMVSAALVHSICGLYRLPEGDAAPVLANGGFAAEFARRLLASGGATGPVRLGRVEVLLQRPAVFAHLADVIVRETPLLTVRLHTEMIGAGETVALSCRGQREEIRPRIFVDATGDAALATLRGAPCEMEGAARLQRPAFIFALGGVASEALADDARLRLAQRLAQAVKAGTLPAGALGAHVRGSGQTGEAFVTIDLEGGVDFDPLSAACLSRLEIEGRDLAQRIAEFLRNQVEGFAASYIAAWPSRVGVRESRRIVGRYRLEADDLLRGAEFPDAVAIAAWPMELRETASGPRLRFPTNGQPCGIPLRALRARDDEALFMAGRCISCSHEAQASVRVIGTCLATGEAAGLAAALTVLHGDCTSDAVNAARERITR